MIRYGNEAGKGGHEHTGAMEVPYVFTTPAKSHTAAHMAEGTDVRTIAASNGIVCQLQ